ncbi:stage V sporulation protein AA [Paenibacillus xerothermodurans]|uniref:Stage V sporulation protein AA n=1 Tax=Paenibacillus xerothermodurans TaxID=1977292 RepID=A0A2W1P4D5_PAEXE|nr:stage V sporulation protein AA [Paenibacillus xerothermodurans]PZE21998.1 stage V sporulation protein AA [Paenibacillus xerothermodurans]
MQQATSPTLYIRLRKRVSVRPGQSVHLGQIAQLLVDAEYEPALRQLWVHKPEAHEGNIILIDMLMIVKKIKEMYPFLQIEHFGDPHCLIEVVEERKPPNLLVIGVVWLLLFTGSGLAIMNFHADVSMAEVHQRIYQLLTGHRVEHPLLLQIPYSLGIGLGMMVFFNHLFKKKFNEEPSPLEVEMFMYQENVNYYVIMEEYGKMHEKENKHD